MQILYPDIKPYKTHQLSVDETHTLYIEESGDPDGIPIVFIHGGPGLASSPQDRRFFDPEKYRIILFDQRGCGQSLPHASLKNNTTAHLIDDIEAIRELLGLEQWALFGGSWGATLALLYAQAYPKHVNGMILRGVFLARQQDLHWFYQSGADQIFPDYWQEFVKPIPENDRSNMIQAYYQKLSGDNELAKMSAAKAWSLWEGHCATLRPNPEVVSTFSDPHIALALAVIEAHYFVNQVFIEENQILNNIERLHGIPASIVHGRYDMVCRLDNSHKLYSAWPDAELNIIRDAGHSSREPSIVDALIKSTTAMSLLISGEGAPSC
ncbi:MAG: prolyl aminopeptidase [Alteromonadaceae bacterium]|nr:MAG: prolyl aminopeptidase [Alteromonadaceae bacterium]